MLLEKSRVFNRWLMNYCSTQMNRFVLSGKMKRSPTHSFKIYPLCNMSSRHVQYTGVKGFKGRKPSRELNDEEGNSTNGDEDLNLEDKEYDVLANTAMNLTRDSDRGRSVFVIQPYVKWGSKKLDTSPDLQLQEAEALISSLPGWKVPLSMKVPLESLGKKTLFGKGKMEELKNFIRTESSAKENINCIFISKGTLSLHQKRFLEKEFHMPVMDRYSIVVQILRHHATTAEARIQVAMAEIPYILAQIKDSNVSTSNRQGYFLTDSQREILRRREKKLQDELEKIRARRKLLRIRRVQRNYPSVAVVGYTNAGKTSLIKALTKEETMQPRNQLFATLDVTAHAGVLPCNLEVIYMDTVGFISDIPTGLIECFVATLEDAMLADVILHVQDVSHDNYVEQRKHVEKTLKSLEQTISSLADKDKSPPPIVNVGNKVDLLPEGNITDAKFDSDLFLVSSKTLAGTNDLLEEIEKKILETTNRKKMTFRVSNGGQEMAWLFKNAAVTNSRADPEDAESILIDSVISKSTLEQFKHYFVRNAK